MKASRPRRANRANARRSTGPKTVLGKMRSAKNSRRHGLSVPVSFDPELERGVSELVVAIVGKTQDEKRLLLARRVAEAQIDLVRIQRTRRAPGQTGTAADALAEAVARDAALDRYERRARSRRTAAIRAFDLFVHLSWDRTDGRK
jgi:hypothetical protein